MKVTIVHLVDQIQYEPECAQLAQLAVEEGREPAVVLADYGTSDAAFLAAFAEAPELALLRVTRQTLPVIGHMATTLRERHPSLPIAFFGPLPTLEPALAAAILPDAWVLPGESEGPVRALLRDGADAIPAGTWRVRDGEITRGAEPTPLAADAFPNPHYGVFGGGALFRRGLGTGLFGETGVLPVEATVGGATSPACAARSAFFRHLPGPLRVRSREQLEARIRQAFSDFSTLRRLEWRDPDPLADGGARDAILGLMAERFPTTPWSLRARPERLDASTVAALAAAGAGRVVLELDRGPGVDVAPTGLVPAAALESAARELRRAGLELGVLASFGWPGETPAEIAAKLDLLRGLAPDRLRVVAFEPGFGHPVYAHCESAGLLPTDEESWNREVHHPLVQACLPEEAWYLAWQDILDLQAEVAAAAEPVA
ncbi:MAG: hypothetical protein R3F20_00410 [Planctomycetota bacterium]